MPDKIPLPTDIGSLCQQAAGELPARYDNRDERPLRGAVFSLRRMLIAELCAHYGQDSVRKEDLLRDALPPLTLEPLTVAPQVASWRQACAAFLGLLLGMGLGQALCLLAQVVAENSYNNALVLLCGGAFAWLFVWGLHAVVELRVARAADPAPQTWWRRFMGLFSQWRGWVGLGVVLLVRDAWQGTLPVEMLAAAVSYAVGQGYVLPFFANAYTLLVWICCCTLCAAVPVHVSRESLASCMELAAKNWWAGAALAAENLLGQEARDLQKQREQWQKLGHELYSFAQELPPTKSDWLTKHLQGLGFTSQQDTGLLHWTAAMTDQYAPMGHISEGDPCYVDIAPLFENGTLVRKGAVRKVR